MQRYTVGQYAQSAINIAGVALLISTVLFVVGVVLGEMSPYAGAGK